MEYLKNIRKAIGLRKNQIITEIEEVNASIEKTLDAKEINRLNREREFSRGEANGLLVAENLVMGAMVEILEAKK